MKVQRLGVIRTVVNRFHVWEAPRTLSLAVLRNAGIRRTVRRTGHDIVHPWEKFQDTCNRWVVGSNPTLRAKWNEARQKPRFVLYSWVALLVLTFCIPSLVQDRRQQWESTKYSFQFSGRIVFTSSQLPCRLPLTGLMEKC